MIMIGECIHVLSKKVKTAIETRDAATIQELAVAQAKNGAQVIDLNIGPSRKTGVEVMQWMVDIVQEAAPGARLSLDTTNAAAIEAGLQRAKVRCLINSTDATEARLNAMMPLAAKYDADIIALTLGDVGLPTSADARIQLAVERIIPAAMEHGVPIENIYFDPLVLTINGNQDQALETTNAVRFFKQMSDPPPMTTCGLSNVSNSAPAEMRPLINRVFLAMMLGAGLDSAIIDALDGEMLQVIRILDQRDASTPLGQLYLGIYDAYAAGDLFDNSGVDTSNEDLRAVVKTVEALENRWIYAHSYLRL